MNRFFLRSGVLLEVLLFSASLLAEKDKRICLSQDEYGAVKQVNSLRSVPIKFRKKAKCIDPNLNYHLAKPEEVKLDGTVREEDMSSSLGRIKLRWPRKVETLFGRTPKRALADAARTVSRTLKKSGFSSKLRTLNLDWNVVFMDEELPEKQIPTYLVSNCHPAWMTPPANIYIVSQRVAAGCGGGKSTTRVADSDLAAVLLHEMGHVIEYHMTEEQAPRDRMRSEGFASWFEQYAADNSSVIPKGSVKKKYLYLAKIALREQPSVFHFGGSPFDYARASLYFHAVVEKKRVRGLMELYEHIKGSRIGLIDAVKLYTGWSQKKLDEELLKVIGG